MHVQAELLSKFSEMGDLSHRVIIYIYDFDRDYKLSSIGSPDK